MAEVVVEATGACLEHGYVRVRVPADTKFAGGVEAVFDAAQSDGWIELFPALGGLDYVVTRDDAAAVVVTVGPRPAVPDSIGDLDGLAESLERYYTAMRVITFRRDTPVVEVSVTHCNGDRWGTSTDVEIAAHAVVTAAEVAERLRAGIDTGS